LAVVVAFVLGVWALCRLGLRFRGTGRQDRLERGLALFALGIWVAANIWQFLPWNYRFDESLPLHVCDLLGVVAFLSMATRHRWPTALLYFYGLGLSTQTFITPVVKEGPIYSFFWLFWVTHMVVVGYPFYSMVVRGYRPTWRDYGLAVGVAAAYFVLILPFDLLLDVNYGYVGRGLPERPTLIDALGSWPWRLAPLSLLVCVGLFLPLLPWLVARWFRSFHRPAALESNDHVRRSRSSISGT
jgi:hypothetical integral membrane protein (TIGR02206 family)